MLPALRQDRRSAPGRGRRGVTPAWVLLAALFSLFAQGTGLAHLALVSHVQCYEHDALAHADGQAKAAFDSDAALSAQPSHAGTAQIGGAGESAEHADDHCLAAGLRQRETILSGPAVAAERADTTRLAPAMPLVGEVPAAPVPLILLAPKSSPPALV
ncbi:MAG TPA: hypothetical protein VGF45_08370 [Polyangia bacterium]